MAFRKPKMYRQGDVLIRRLKKLPPEPEGGSEKVERDNGRVVLAYGEVTGHAHAIHDPGVTAWQLGEGRMLLDVQSKDAL